MTACNLTVLWDFLMPTRNVVLTDHQEKVIDNLVGSGRYQNASEVLREGLRLVERRETEDATKLEVLRKAAAAGFGALDRGELKAFESIGDLQAYLNAVSEKIISGIGE
jgi:antitoxin ParD1/3/4